jgi:hypothetical protein
VLLSESVQPLACLLLDQLVDLVPGDEQAPLFEDPEDRLGTLGVDVAGVKLT